MKKLALSFITSLLLKTACWGVPIGFLTIPASSTGTVQFNLNGLFGGTTDFVYNTTTKTLFIASVTVTGAIVGTFYGNGSNLSGITGGSVGGGGSVFFFDGAQSVSITTAAFPGATVSFNGKASTVTWMPVILSTYNTIVTTGIALSQLKFALSLDSASIFATLQTTAVFASNLKFVISNDTKTLQLRLDASAVDSTTLNTQIIAAFTAINSTNQAFHVFMDTAQQQIQLVRLSTGVLAAGVSGSTNAMASFISTVFSSHSAMDLQHNIWFSTFSSMDQVIITSITNLAGRLDSSTNTIYSVIKTTSANLSNVNNTINTAGNPVSWNSLKDVPAGFADGTDDGAGGGISASDFNTHTSSADQKDVVIIASITNIAARLDSATSTIRSDMVIYQNFSATASQNMALVISSITGIAFRLDQSTPLWLLKADFVTMNSTMGSKDAVIITSITNIASRLDSSTNAIRNDMNAYQLAIATSGSQFQTLNSTTMVVRKDTGTLATTVSLLTVVGLDEGTPQSGGQITAINCTGAGIGCSQTNGTWTINVAGGAPGGSGGGAAIFDGRTTTAFTSFTILNIIVLSANGVSTITFTQMWVGFDSAGVLSVSSFNSTKPLAVFSTGTDQASRQYQFGISSFTVTVDTIQSNANIVVSGRPIDVAGVKYNNLMPTATWTNTTDGIWRLQSNAPGSEIWASTFPNNAISTMSVSFSSGTSLYITVFGSPTISSGGDICMTFNGQGMTGNWNSIYQVVRTTFGINSLAQRGPSSSTGPAVALQFWGRNGNVDTTTSTQRTVELRIRGNNPNWPKLGKFEGVSVASAAVNTPLSNVVNVGGSWAWFGNEQITKVSTFFCASTTGVVNGQMLIPASEGVKWGINSGMTVEGTR